MKFILMAEYVIICFPFILISLLKSEMWQVLPMISVSFILPMIKSLRIIRNTPVLFPFFYKGGIDLLYTIRMTWWIFPLLLLVAVEGCINDNINLIKVSIIAETVVISLFGRDPRPLIMQYGSFRLFVKENAKMVLQDVTLLLLPFLCILLYKEHDVLSSLNMLLSGLLAVMSFLLLKYITMNVLIFFVNFIILATAYLTTIMLGWGCFAFVTMIAIYLFINYDKYNFLWR